MSGEHQYAVQSARRDPLTTNSKRFSPPTSDESSGRGGGKHKLRIVATGRRRRMNGVRAWRVHLVSHVVARARAKRRRALLGRYRRYSLTAVGWWIFIRRGGERTGHWKEADVRPESLRDKERAARGELRTPRVRDVSGVTAVVSFEPGQGVSSVGGPLGRK